MLKTTLNKAQHNLIGGGGDFTLNSKPPKSNSKIPHLNLPKYIKFSALCATLLFGSLAQADFDKYCSNGNCIINADETSNNTIAIPRATTINTFDNLGAIEVTSPKNNGIYNLGKIQNLTNDVSGIITGYYGILNENSIETLTNLGTITRATYGIENRSKITTFINNGIVQMTNNGFNNNGTTTTFINNDTLIGNFYGIFNRRTIQEITNTGIIEGINTAGIYNPHTITTINNSGVIKGRINGITNSGTITILNNNNGGNINSISNQKTITNLSNSGEIARIDNSNAGYINNFTNETSGEIETLTNQGTIDTFENKGKIERVESINGTINNQITNTGTISDIMLRVANQITNSGAISSLSADSIQGGITNTNNGNINTLTAESINNGVINQGTIQTLTSTGAISGGITNSGTIGNLNNYQGTIDTLTNSGAISNLTNSGTITHTLTNSGTISHLNNTGTLAGGIVNESGGTITLNSTGSIGLNAINNLHISNANNVEKAITIENISPHFDKLKVDAGVKGGIFIKQITAQVEREGLTLEDLIDEQGVSFGSDCQNENCIIGLDENGNESEFSVFVRNSSVILDDFYAKRGQSVGLTLDTSALSGSTFSQSLIANSRLRDIRIDTILKEFSIKNFQTNFENSKESNLESLESYNLGKVRKYASLTQDMIPSENAEFTAQTWSDEHLIQELDEIFIANKNKGEYYTFIVPYFSYDSSDIGGGDIKGHTRGFLAGIQTPLTNNAGIVGAFFGYERADKGLSSPSFNGGLDINDTSFLMGVSYYNIFHRKGLVEYYLSGNAKLDRIQSKINRSYEGGETKAKPKSIGYGIESKMGANIYNIYDNSVLSPEIGLAYQGISMENYTLNYGSVKEHYYSEDTNFVDIITALRWQRAANPTVKYNVSLGSYWNLYEDGKVRGIAAGIPLNEKVRTSDYFAFTNVGITYAILENAELSFNYNGILGDKTQSHTGYVRLGIWW